MPHNRAPSNPRVFPPQAPDGFGQRKIGFGFFGVDWKFRQSAKILLRAKRGEQPTHLNNDGVRLARGAPRGDPRGKADPGAALGTPEREPRDLPHLVSLSAPIEEEEKKKLTQSTSLNSLGSMADLRGSPSVDRAGRAEHLARASCRAPLPGLRLLAVSSHAPPRSDRHLSWPSNHPHLPPSPLPQRRYGR